MKDLKYESVGFNVDAILKHPTAQALAAHKSYQHLWPKILPEQRVKRLTEVWDICQQIKSHANNL